jgi:hypothetical protein
MRNFLVMVAALVLATGCGGPVLTDPSPDLGPKVCCFWTVREFYENRCGENCTDTPDGGTTCRCADPP